jgi:hypothetical protein
VTVLIVWVAVAGVSVVLLAILAYGLYGQLRRLQTTVEKVQADLMPKIESLRPETPQGRHRAG